MRLVTFLGMDAPLPNLRSFVSDWTPSLNAAERIDADASPEATFPGEPYAEPNTAERMMFLDWGCAVCDWRIDAGSRWLGVSGLRFNRFLQRAPNKAY